MNLHPALLGLIAFFSIAVVIYVAYSMSKMDVGFIGVVYTYFQVIPITNHLGVGSVLQSEDFLASSRDFISCDLVSL